MPIASILPISIVVAATALAAPQDAPASSPGDSWALQRAAEGDSVLAIAPFNNGITLVARCSFNSFSLLIDGLPPSDLEMGSERNVMMRIGEQVAQRGVWTSADARVAFSRTPAIAARKLRSGGRLEVIVPGADETSRRTRYVMDLSAESPNLTTTMEKCGLPLVDPRDDERLGDGGGIPMGLEWATRPIPEYPSATVHGTPPNGGVATLTCVIGPGGRLRDCDIESEFPANSGFGASARRAAAGARLKQSNEAKDAGAPFEGERVTFTMRFRMG